MARPQKPDAEKRRQLMQIRVRAHELKEFKQAAERAGLDLSSWARSVLIPTARRELRKAELS